MFPSPANSLKDYWEAWFVDTANAFTRQQGYYSATKETNLTDEDLAALKANFKIPRKAFPGEVSDWYWFLPDKKDFKDPCDTLTITGKVFYVDNVPFEGKGGFKDAGFVTGKVPAAGNLRSVSNREGGDKVEALIKKYGAAEPIDHELRSGWSNMINSGTPEIQTTPKVDQIGPSK